MDGSSLRTEEEIIQMYRKYAGMVYQISFLLCKHKADAEDMLQSVFVKLMQYEKPFASEEHLKAWLIVVTQNLCKNHLKHWWRKTVDISEMREKPVEREESRLEDLILSLPSKYKIPLYLYYYEGYSIDEIAGILDRKPATVATRLHTARKKLKNMVEEDRHEES